MTNCQHVLPPNASDLAQQVLMHPYQFDFLTLGEATHEREVGGQDFYVDLLFCHRKLRCLVAVDLKTGRFQPKHAGKVNFTLAALDDHDREPSDNPSIGLILCREHNRIVVEYARRYVDAPVGVARYQLMLADALPAALADALSSPENLGPGMLAGEAGHDE